jgi:hypothetical protein
MSIKPNSAHRFLSCLAGILSFFILLTFPRGYSLAARPISPLSMPDMASYLPQHDLVYERAPERWLDGIPLANGEVGAMIWGTGAPWKITLDSYAAWETREVPVDPDKYNYRWLRRAVAENREQEVWDTMFPSSVNRSTDGKRQTDVTRLPMPRIEVRFERNGEPRAFESFQARLRLHEGIVEGEFQVQGHKVPWRAWTQNGVPLLVIQFDDMSPDQTPSVRATLDHLDDGTKKTLSDWGYPPAEIQETVT